MTRRFGNGGYLYCGKVTNQPSKGVTVLKLVGRIVVLAALATPLQLNAQSIESSDGGIKVRLTGRLKVQYNTSSVAREEGAAARAIPFSTFETREVRLSANVEVGQWITGVIEPDFALGQITLRDAYIDLAFNPRFGLRLGQFKKPFSALELESSTRTMAIERGVRIRGLTESLQASAGAEPLSTFLPNFEGKPLLPDETEMLGTLGYSGYDMGVEAHGKLGRFAYQVGAFNGNGANRRADIGNIAFASRITYVPFSSLPLTLGGAASYREFFRRGAAGDADFSKQVGKAVEVDAEWGGFRRPGLHLQLEGSTGRNLVEDGTFVGAQGIVGLFRPTGGGRIEGIEPLVRVGYADADRDRPGASAWLLTPGVNIYFAGRNRFMVNWDLFSPVGEPFHSAHALRAQAQIHF
jgi:hypothetical protein